MEPAKQLRVRLREDRLLKLCRDRGISTDRVAIARYTGLHRATVARLLTRKQAPGETIIAHLMHTFEVKFEELFEITEDDDDRVTAAA